MNYRIILAFSFLISFIIWVLIRNVKSIRENQRSSRTGFWILLISLLLFSGGWLCFYFGGDKEVDRAQEKAVKVIKEVYGENNIDYNSSYSSMPYQRYGVISQLFLFFSHILAIPLFFVGAGVYFYSPGKMINKVIMMGLSYLVLMAIETNVFPPGEYSLMMFGLDAFGAILTAIIFEILLTYMMVVILKYIKLFFNNIQSETSQNIFKVGVLLVFFSIVVGFILTSHLIINFSIIFNELRLVAGLIYIWHILALLHMITVLGFGIKAMTTDYNTVLPSRTLT